jgi:hypothetical protein
VAGAVKEDTPDLAVIDWMLPRLSGIELIRRLRARPETQQSADHAHRPRRGDRARSRPRRPIVSEPANLENHKIRLAQIGGSLHFSRCPDVIAVLDELCDRRAVEDIVSICPATVQLEDAEANFANC